MRFDVLFLKDECYLTKDDLRINVEHYENGLYGLLTQPLEQVRTVMEQKTKCVHQWHEELAH